MTYRTRHMVALKPHTYFGDELAAGDCFYATPVDGGYFLKIGRASDAPEPVIPPLPIVAAPPVADPVEPVGEMAAEPAALPETETPADPDPVVAPRRRGRPPRNAAQD